MVLSRFKISIYRNFLDFFFNINSREIAAGIGDRLNIGLIFKGFFRNLPRRLRSDKIFSVIRILRSIVPSF
jgi:hypothetical protein